MLRRTKLEYTHLFSLPKIKILILMWQGNFTFVDNNNATIKVTQPFNIALANELILEPFLYTSHFKKEF